MSNSAFIHQATNVEKCSFCTEKEINPTHKPLYRKQFKGHIYQKAIVIVQVICIMVAPLVLNIMVTHDRKG